MHSYLHTQMDVLIEGLVLHTYQTLLFGRNFDEEEQVKGQQQRQKLKQGAGIAVPLHCTDLNNPGAIKLYRGQGFKSIKVPEGASWPQPKTSPDVRFNFMMKLLNNNNESQTLQEHGDEFIRENRKEKSRMPKKQVVYI